MVGEGPLPAPPVVLGAGELRAGALGGSLACCPEVGERFVAQRRHRGLDAGIETASALVLDREQWRSEHDLALAGLRPLHALAEDAAGAIDEDRHHRGTGAVGEIRSATFEILAPAVGRTPAFGEDDQAPSVVDQVAQLVAALAAGDLAVDGERVQRESGQRALDALVEEVVGCRRDDQPGTPRLGHGDVHQRRVDVAVMVGREDDGRRLVGALEIGEAVVAHDLRAGDEPHEGTHRPVGEHRAGCCGRRGTSPIGLEVGAQLADVGWHHHALGHAGLAVREAQRLGRLQHCLHRRARGVAHLRGASKLADRTETGGCGTLHALNLEAVPSARRRRAAPARGGG